LQVLLQGVYEVFKRFGLVMIIPPNMFILFDCLSGAGRSKKVRKGFWLIEHTVLWLSWKARSDISFANGVKDYMDLVGEIKAFSWR
jgi:hypothetical protein